MTPHHFSIFYWSKQITGPAQIQGEGRETPQLTGRSDSSCRKRTSSAYMLKIYLMVWRIFYKLLLAPFIFNLTFAPPPLKHLSGAGHNTVSSYFIQCFCPNPSQSVGEKCSWVDPLLGESAITTIAKKNHVNMRMPLNSS